MLLPEGWMPSAVAVDIDGTLTDDDRTLHPGIIKALRDIEDSGIPVILATGNVRPVAYALHRLLRLSGPMVCENGGVIWNPHDGFLKVMHDGNRARMAAEWLSKEIEGLDSRGIESNAWRESEWCLRVGEDDEEIRGKLANSQWKDMVVVRTGFAIHVNEPGLNKGEGLKLACRNLGIPISEVLAVGDAPNDIPMFEVAGCSIAVGGSYPETIAAATFSSKYRRAETIVKLAEEICN